MLKETIKNMGKTEKIIWIVAIVLTSVADIITNMQSIQGFILPAVIANIGAGAGIVARVTFMSVFGKSKKK